jgi:mono/diheme cytochrome c family protein
MIRPSAPRFLSSWIVLASYLTPLPLLHIAAPSALAAPAAAVTKLESSAILKTLQATAQSQVTIENDPAYKSRVVYSGYPLKQALKILGIKEDSDLQFIARDGYKVTVALSQVPLDRGFLAIAEVGSKSGAPFRPVGEGRDVLDPAPLILTWSGPSLPNENLPYPLAVVTVAYGPSGAFDGASFPRSHPELRHGYALFRTNCQSCHSINLDGGVVGPELNVPHNVFEYINNDAIPQIVENPNDWRYGTKMPPFNHLPQADRQSILDYVKGMAADKVCQTRIACDEYNQAKTK